MANGISRPGLVAGWFAVLVVTFVALRPLLPVDETRYLAVAWEMWLTGDLLHLTRNFELYAHKPPLLFWLINLVWHAVGVSEFAARLVAPAFGVATVLATGALARSFWPEDRGIAGRSAAVLTGFSVFLIYASATLFDTMLALATVAGIAALWRIGRGDRRWRTWIAFGVALGLGIYAKGPVIFLHLAPAALLMAVWAPARPPARKLAAGLGLALLCAAALVALWLVPALLKGDAAYRHEILWRQTAGRVAGGLAHDRPFWFFIVLLPILIFPWGWSLGLWGRVGKLVASDPAARLIAVWAGAGLMLFSVVSGKQAHYLLPEFPAVALLVARTINVAGTARHMRSLAPTLFVLAGFVAIVAGTVPGLQLDASVLPRDTVVSSGVAAIVLGVVGLRLTFVTANLLAGTGLALGLHLGLVMSGGFSGYDVAPIVSGIAAHKQKGLAIAGMTYNAEFNFAGRLTEPVAILATANDVDTWRQDHPGGLILGPLGTAAITAAPQTQARYNGAEIGLWPVPAPALTARVSGHGG